MTHAFRAPVIVLVVTLGIFPMPGVSSEGTAGIESRAYALLRQMADYLKTAEEFTFRSEVIFDQVLDTGEKLQFGRTAEVSVRRPDRLQADVRGDEGIRRYWYDGKQFTQLDVDRNVYASVGVPARIDAALDFMAKRHGVTTPVADFVYSDPYAVLTEHVQSGAYIGLSHAHGVRCHHLAFRQDNIDWQLWIEDGRRPLPRMIVITYKNVKSAPQFSAFLSEWDFNPRLADSLFTFLAPPNAAQTEFPAGGE